MTKLHIKNTDGTYRDDALIYKVSAIRRKYQVDDDDIEKIITAKMNRYKQMYDDPKVWDLLEADMRKDAGL